MSNTKSFIKRLKINKFRNKRNCSKKSMLKTYIKKVKFEILNKNKKSAFSKFKILQSILDKLVSKNILHINKSSRYKSRLYKKINNLT